MGSSLNVRGETLQYLIEACGFDKSTATNVFHNWLPFHHARFEYDDGGMPTYMSWFHKSPQLSHPHSACTDA